MKLIVIFLKSIFVKQYVICFKQINKNIPHFLKNQHCICMYIYIYIYIHDVIQQGTEQCQQIQTNKNYTKIDNQK